MAGQGPGRPVSLFYSYSHRDEDLRRKLEIQLSVLRRGGLIAEWHDRKLEPGDAWKDEIDRHLTSADIVLLLVSADFVHSDYCWGEEMTKALARHARGEALVIPVILRHCRWQITPLGALQAVPRDGLPITAWVDQDEAFTDVVLAIERAVEKLQQAATPKPPIAKPPPPRPRTGSSGTLSVTRGLRTAPTPPPDPPPEPDVPLPPATRPAKARTFEPGTVFRDIDVPWCPEMVVLPAGSFVMGSPQDEEERDDHEGPQHEVRFAEPFALGRYPVTFEEYDHFCGEAERERPDDRGWGRERQPVIDVSWEDAQAYCQWLSEQTGAPYRLPSEAEWEYACRAGTTTPFWTGATITTDQANYDGNYTYRGGKKGKYRRQTTPVDTFAPNSWGLHDMHGNVWEWCADRWHGGYEGAPGDGTAWMEGEDSRRVLRGGSWFDFPGDLRSAFRDGRNTDNRLSDWGFRVARTLSRSESLTP